MLGTKRPIFMVGCTNSGTKCLFYSLREHPDVGGLDRELHFLGVQPNLEGRLNRLFALFPCFKTNFAHVDVPPRCYGTGPMEAWEVELYIQEFTRRRPECWKEGTRLLFKDPKLSLRLTWIKALWPDAIIIGIVRNPWATIEGIVRRLPIMGDVALGLDIPTATAQWINTYTTIMLDHKKIGDFHWVKYEDLIEAKKFPGDLESNCMWARLLGHCELPKKDFTIPNGSKYSVLEDTKDIESWKRLNKWEREFISYAARGLIEDLGYQDMQKEVESINE